MQAALFSRAPYLGSAEQGKWPVAGRSYSVEAAQRSMEHCLAEFRLADEVGFDWVTVAEHHYAPFSLTPNPMVMAGALTQCVRRAKIALLGADIPILNPVRVAEEFAMLDTLTGGRVIAGMLRGTSNEYVTYGTNPAESRERFEEALQLIVRAWTEPYPFGWQGRYYEYRTISIWPRPMQQPHPPIFMSASSPEAGEFAARNHVGAGFAVTTLPLAREASRRYREQAHACGWDPTPNEILYRVAIYVAASDEQAVADLQAAAAGPPAPGISASNRGLDDAVARAGFYGEDTERQRARLRPARELQERVTLGQLLAGGPETVLKQLRCIRDEVGAGIVDLTFIPMPAAPDKTLHAIERFGTAVLPRLHEL